MKYACERCKKIFRQKIDYTRHINRKKPCKRPTHKVSSKNKKHSHKFECCGCHKTYASKYNLKRHMIHSCKILKDNIKMRNQKEENNETGKCILEQAKEHLNNTNINTNNNTEKIKREKNSPKREKNSPKEKKILQKKCKYCEKVLYAKKYLKKHEKICKSKQKYDFEKLLKEKRVMEEENKLKIQELTKALENVEDEYFAFSKQVALNNKNINVTNNIDNKKINMCFIIKNYTIAKNFDDVMTPELTKTEIKYIKEFGVASGTQMLLNERCVEGLKIEERPIHCVDSSRNKYMLRSKDDWKIDKNAKIIISSAIEKIKSIYNIKIDGTEDEYELKHKLEDLCSLLNIEAKGKDRREILKHLNIKTSIKNIKV